METVYWEWSSSGYRSDGESYKGVFCPTCQKPYNWFDDNLARQVKFFRCQQCSISGFLEVTNSLFEPPKTFDVLKIRKPYDLDEKDTLHFSEALINVIKGEAAKQLQELEKSIQDKPDYNIFTFQMYQRNPDLFVILFGQDEYDELTTELLMETELLEKYGYKHDITID
jgi:hypothetical protein